MSGTFEKDARDAGFIPGNAESENLHKVAEGNEITAYKDRDGWHKISAELAPGSCEVCGCPPSDMPMVFRGTGWCSELHHKAQQNKEES